MRKLLIPLIFLLTGCVNNLSVRTEVGESYFIPNETIFVSSFDKEDFLELYKLSKTTLANGYLEDIENNNKYFKDCDDGILSTKQCKEIWEPEQREIEYKEKYNSTLNEMNTSLETFKSEVLEGKHWVKISYRPVFKNLNGMKRPLRKVEKGCYNPKLKEEIKAIWKELEKYDFMIYKDVMAGIDLEIKLCDKYANF